MSRSSISAPCWTRISRGGIGDCDEGTVHENIGEIGLTPIIRLIRGSGPFRPFVEAGAGVRLLSSPRISSTFTLSTAFQFADGKCGRAIRRAPAVPGWLPVSACFGWRHKEPNPSMIFHSLYLQYNF